MKNMIFAFLFVFSLQLIISFMLSYPLMLLWNLCLVPAMTTLNEVGWLQMWGISFLLGLLFKTSVNQKK